MLFLSYLINLYKKSFSAKNFLEASQKLGILSLGLLGLGIIMAGTPHRTQTDSITNYTVSGGLSIAFMELISLAERVLSASSAYFNFGLATAKSFSHSAFMISASLTHSETLYSSS